MTMLTADQIDHYKNKGYLSPVSALTSNEAKEIREEIENIESENLVIRDTDNTSLSIFQLNKIHNVKIKGKTNIYYPDKSIVIQFKNINME